MRILFKIIFAIVGCVIGLFGVAVLMELVVGVKYNPIIGAPVGLLLGAIGWKLAGRLSPTKPQ